MTRYGNATTVGELVILLQKFCAEYGSERGWNGWDDESLIIQRGEGTEEFYITNEANPE